MMEVENIMHKRYIMTKLEDDERRSISVTDHDQTSMASHKFFAIDYDEIQ